MHRDVFQALAHPTRRSILLMLAANMMTAGNIAANFDAARPTISKHMKILIESDLVDQTKNGREIYYTAKSKRIQELDNWIGQFRSIWESRFEKLDNVLEEK